MFDDLGGCGGLGLSRVSTTEVQVPFLFRDVSWTDPASQKRDCWSHGIGIVLLTYNHGQCRVCPSAVLGRPAGRFGAFRVEGLEFRVLGFPA